MRSLLPSLFTLPLALVLATPGFAQSMLDSDSDGLTDQEELDGWSIVVDFHGYGMDAPLGLLSVQIVTSDPFDPDTDDDGLGDQLEYLIRSDPTSSDTDGDVLTDEEEWRSTLSNPNSVDSDADSRGPDHDQTPDANLFDEFELRVYKTSPIDADTDGDGRTDHEEIGHPFFHPLIAELPQARLEIVGDVSLFLNVEYAETMGGSREYGTELSQSVSMSQTLGSSGSLAESVGVHQETALGTEAGGNFTVALPPSVDISASISETETSGTSSEVTQESGWSVDTESAVSAEQSYSEYVTESQEFTEVASTGRIALSFRLTNDGFSAYTLTNLGVSVLKWSRSEELWSPSKKGDPLPPGEFEVVATLFPSLESSRTLSATDSTCTPSSSR